MPRKSNYDKYPCVPLSASASQCWVGWRDITSRLRSGATENRCVLSVECYPGAFERALGAALEQGLRPSQVIYTPDLLKPASAIDHMLSGVLADDPVFGRMNDVALQSFFDEEKFNRGREKVAEWKQGLLLIVGVGAALLDPDPDTLVYAEVARWE